MKSQCRAALGLTLAALHGLTGCRGLPFITPEAQTPAPSNYAGDGATLSTTGHRQWQLQTLKELHDITVQCDEEKTKRIQAENDLERVKSESSRLQTQNEQITKALAAAETRIAELETQLAEAQAGALKLQRELELTSKKLVEAQTRFEQEKQRGDDLVTKLMSEQSDHLETKIKVAKLQIEIKKRELGAEQAGNNEKAADAENEEKE